MSNRTDELQDEQDLQGLLGVGVGGSRFLPEAA